MRFTNPWTRRWLWFLLRIWGIQNKSDLVKKFENLGGRLTSIISDNSFIGTHNVEISPGVIIMPGEISNNVKIGKAGLIYYNSVIIMIVLLGILWTCAKCEYIRKC